MLGADAPASHRNPAFPEKGDTMIQIPLRLVLHGLIALVPMNNADGADHMTALLLDARTRPPEVDERCFVAHQPMLEVRTQTSSECVAISGCHPDGQKCHCDLERQDLSLEIDPLPTLTRQQLSGDVHELPFDNV